MGTLGDGTTGIGMTSDRTRARMIERLRAEGIRDEVVLSAMNAVPRHIFVDEALAIRAYDDSPLPIGHGQTISQPWVVARMTELARNGRELDGVLEIGTGCGYQTAVLAQVAKTVYTVERIVALVNKARRNLQSLKRQQRARSSTATAAPISARTLAVDAIIVAAGATHVPTALLKLPEAGRPHGAAARAATSERERGVAASDGDRSDARRASGSRRSMR